jgi:hypothetical protein
MIIDEGDEVLISFARKNFIGGNIGVNKFTWLGGTI